MHGGEEAFEHLGGDWGGVVDDDDVAELQMAGQSPEDGGEVAGVGGGEAANGFEVV